MNPEKLLDLQMQMRQNNSELQSFIGDLDSWESEIKAKDEALRNPESSKTKQNDKLPPVRNSLVKKKKKIKKASEAKSNEKASKVKPKIKGYDFRGWDKYDVDKALAELSEDDSKHSSSSEYETDEEWEAQRRMQQADLYKTQGNDYFKSGDFDKAVECYTQGMSSDPSNAILPANRAMALLKQDKYGPAESDCTLAISLDPTYAKAFSRRATARLKLSKLEEAQEDFRKVLRLEPDNKMAKKEISRIELMLRPEPEEVITEETGIVKAVSKPMETRSKKPLKRIKIEEIGRDLNEDIQKEIAQVKSQQSKSKQIITENDDKDFSQYLSSPENVSSSLSANQVSRQAASSQSGNLPNLPSEPDVKTTLPRSQETPHLPVASELSSNNLDEGTSRKLDKDSDSSEAKFKESPRTPAVPINSFHFQSDCKMLKNHPDQFYQYLKAIQAENLPSLLGEALDANILMQIISTLDKYYSDNDDPYRVLSSLVKAKRFSITSMFLSKEEKKVAASIFSKVKSSGKYSSSDIKKVEKQYS